MLRNLASEDLTAETLISYSLVKTSLCCPFNKIAYIFMAFNSKFQILQHV